MKVHRLGGRGLLALLSCGLVASCEGCFNFPPPDAGPGDDAGVVAGDLVLNEVMSSNQSTFIPGSADFSDWIELKNRGEEPHSLDGFRLADSGSEGAFPDGITLAPGAWLVVLANDTTTQGTPALPAFPFKLSASNGDSLRLIDPDGTTVDAVTFGPLGPDQSYGRLPDGEGAFAELDFPSPGRANDDPGEGEGEGEGECVPPFTSAPPVFINEASPVNSTVMVDGELAPFLELYNAGDTQLSLDGLTLADNAALEGMYFLPDVELAAHAFLVIVADGQGPGAGAVPHTTAGLALSDTDTEVVLADRCGTPWHTLPLAPDVDGDELYGLVPDGDPSGAQTLGTATPGAANL